MLHPTSVTKQHQKEFRKSGFIYLPKLMTESAFQQIKCVHSRLVKQAISILEKTSSSQMPMSEYYRKSEKELIVVPEKENGNSVCRFEYLSGYSSSARDFVAEEIQPLVNTITGESYILFKDKCNEKHPGGGAFTPHQDFSAYQIFEPRLFVTVMIPLVDTTLVNGCLHFSTNSQKIAKEKPFLVKDFIKADGRADPLFLYYENGKNNGDITLEVNDSLEWMPIKTKCRDLVVFDSYAPHYSTANRSQFSRQAIFFTFNPRKYGDLYEKYYNMKRLDYGNPSFHVSTPTSHNSLQ